MRSATDERVPFRAMFAPRSGGWVLLVALVIGILIVVFTLLPALKRIANRPPGDGRTPERYGFVLEPSAIAPGGLMAAQLHRDMAAPLVDPPTIDPAGVAAWTEENRGKYLVASDPVIGVEIGGEARAYPLYWMRFHEVANDTLGGMPVLVLMHPVSRTVAVYDRRVGGRTREFGTSGLVVDSTMMLYARQRDEAGELVVEGDRVTIWDPRTGAARTGPDLEDGLELQRVPFVLTHYGRWMQMHPESTIAARDENLLDRYKNSSFDRYWAGDEPLFALSEPAPSPPRSLEACIVLPGAADGADLVIPESWIVRFAEPSGGAEDPGVRTWWLDVGDRRVGLQHRDEPATITAVAEDGSAIDFVHSAWFSWWRTGRPIRLPATEPSMPLGPGLAVHP
ncbi:MAG: DUF3179 domain-containing (seleno)protein [Planctomycetota bacterium]|jgi:hypothetical protein